MNNNQNSPQEVPQVKSVECDTPKCKCGGRTALIRGQWCFSPDREPYLNGVEEESKVSEGDEWIIGYKCDDCGHLMDLFADDREEYNSRIAELEKQNAVYREALDKIIEYENRGRAKGEPRISDHWYNIAKQALSSKEVGNETKP